MSEVVVWKTDVGNSLSRGFDAGVADRECRGGRKGLDFREACRNEGRGGRLNRVSLKEVLEGEKRIGRYWRYGGRGDQSDLGVT